MPLPPEISRCFVIAMCISMLLPLEGPSQVKTLDNSYHHLRNAETREWSEFPMNAESKELIVIFSATANKSEQTLILRQYDVKQNWQVFLNNDLLGSLAADEKDCSRTSH